MSLVHVFAAVLALGGLVSSVPSAPHHLHKRGGLVVANSSTLQGQWLSLGCFVDQGPGNNTLQGANFTDATSMTEEGCVGYCDARGYIYAGLEYGEKCFCGNRLVLNSSVPMSQCNMPCVGNPNEPCGAQSLLNLFWSNKTGPVTNPGPSGWSFMGCYSEGTTGNALPQVVQQTNVTIKSCTTACGNLGFSLAGAENSNQCFCGNALGNGAVLSPGGVGDCNSTCAGNFSEFCGAPSKLDVYTFGPPPSSSSSSTSSSASTSSSTVASTSVSSSISSSASTSSSISSSSSSSSSTGQAAFAPAVASPSSTSSSSSVKPTQTGPIHVPSAGPYTWIGCYTEGTNSRALTGANNVNYVTMTIEICQAFCSSPVQYTFFGVEYAGECYCGNTLQAGSALTATSACSMLCDGSNLEYCGAGNRLDMYQFNASAPSSSSASSSSTKSATSTGTATATSATPTQTGPIHVPAVGPYSWIGCYTEGTNSRALTGANNANYVTMTIEMCEAFCSSPVQYTYFGVEYSGECYCGNTLQAGSVLTATSACSMLCDGSNLEYCGAGNRLDMYQYNASLPSSSSASPSSTKSTTSTGTTTGTATSVSPTQTGPIHVPSVGPYSWIGCYTEATNSRALTGANNANYVTMTIEMCEAFCSSPVQYTYFGVEYSGECYCGNILQAGSVLTATSACSMLCDGSNLEYCGAGNRLDMYQFNASAPSSSSASPSSTKSATSTGTTTGTATSVSPTQTGPIHVPSVGPYSWIGCYTEGTNSRALTGANNANYVTMTIEMCEAFCSSPVQYTYFGVEYSGECYCGNILQAGSVLTATSACSMLCDGSNLEYCGAGNRLDMYQYNASLPSSSASPSSTKSTTSTGTATATSATPTQTGPIHVPAVGPYSWIGCYTEATNSRALTGANNVNYVTMTIEMCEAFCSSPVQYTYFGVEYSGECYCGNTIQAGSVLTATSACSQLCDGSNLEYCGAGNRLDMYQFNSSLPTSSKSVTSVSSTSSSSAFSSSPSNGPLGWKSAGCYTEGYGNRALAFGQPDSNTNSVESCIQACINLGYTVAGMEYGSQCYCDNAMKNGPTQVPASDCSFHCPGNAAEFCGAGDRLSVYYTGTLTVYSIPATQLTGLPGNWGYSACITDNVNNKRALFWQIILTHNNSATNCLTLCQEFGYMSAGMEYGEECYCGDASSVAASGSTVVADSQCNTPCSGNPETICGSGNRLSYYTWQGTPLYNWATPQGNAAGEFSFFVPGVVVPLMTSQNINGKVTFLEKHGTGAPNSTGAYELDPSLANNFNAAWRTMNLKTDVFCSGGLTLPDKGGRQITVGGWAEESTYGVRLYIPDGSPGQPSTNDWQENVNEVSLQTARWYPSLLLLSNGSILVIGGEVGSNSAPSPSLEILPNPPGGQLKYLDFLQRTDPNNLYPFLAMLPSGNIVILYYNEARILDPVHFDTIKSLPNMPGSVNNFLSGRSYPLEGTGFIFPQYAPFHDPITVMACGGSCTGAGLAIDNCVSIQPEVVGQNWTIERMPSQRVMTCVTALPDGTYLIVNGAEQGVAGFGLASGPNLGAVLFDPSKPVGSRFSVMANTIVARLYHSESMLLQDGRVLISGSDPEDGVHPEEYRVEIFSPPYALSGLQKPTFTITNKDWAYGQSIQITVQLFQGTTATMRVSLLALVTSTHGNSMGMRTLFLQSNCAGNVCTIIAPPNAFVSPPAWHQLFILDGPTPSMSQFVRVGGDPGQLGNWPNFPDFTMPGV